MIALLDIYRSHRGKVSDRWLSYLREYDRIFSDCRDEHVRLLEIGIQNGGSLEIWGRYFPEAALLVGCDIDPLCAGLAYSDSRIAVVVADACSDDGQKVIESHSTVFDIVIEDGSHRSGHIVDAFARYFPLVDDGGLFVAEDLHCSYWEMFEGGLVDPYSSIAFFKRLADMVNHEHWGLPLDRIEYLSGFSVRYSCRFDEEALAQVHSVEFINSMCVIRKRLKPDNQLGPRVIVGLIEQVSANVLQYDGAFSQALDQTSNPWSDPRLVDLAEIIKQNVLLTTQIEALNRTIDARDRMISSVAADQVLENVLLTTQIEALNRAIDARDRMISSVAADQVLESLRIQRQAEEYRAYVAELISAVHARDAQVAELMSAQNRPSARFARLAERTIKKLFPAHSVRRSALAKTLRFADRVYCHGPVMAMKLSFARKTAIDRLPTCVDVVTNMAAAQPPGYAEWIHQNEPDAATLQEQWNASASYDPSSPMFSVILPVYKIPGGILKATLVSLVRQSWQNWECCVAYADIDNEENWFMLEQMAAEEPRIRIRKLEENGGISHNSNAALEMARGEFVALLDHDDELTPWALHDMAQRISEDLDIDFLYSDKDSINASGTLRQNPLFKPQWSPEMLYSVNYLTHLNVMRRSVVLRVGGWLPETDGAQDWDIFLRVAEGSRRIERVTGIGYHWRIIAGSTATGIGAKPYAALGQLRTIEARIRRLGLAANVLPNSDSGFRLVWHLERRPCVNLILHGAQPAGKLASLLAWIATEIDGLVASVAVVRDTTAAMESMPEWFPGGVAIREFYSDGPGDLTATIHAAVQSGDAPVVMFIDLSVTHVARNSLSEITSWALMHPEIAFVGALILTHDETVAEAGRIVGEELRTLPLFRGTPLRHWGPLGGPLWYRNVSAVSPTLAAFKRDSLHLEQQFDQPWPKAFAGCCLDAIAGRLRGVVSPHARAYLNHLPEETLVDWDESFGDDPYFHPAFGSVNPLALKSSAS